ncbi:hypothetical protein PVAG01_00853 [Phlyctema vagabunda]|uniref:Uncharacterized protein n=1 Tax=Phlyctema vagabunda TaxID=108571 RepID=A0ABR4PVN9_9HELO
MPSKSRSSSVQAQNASANSSFATTPSSTVDISAASYHHYHASSAYQANNTAVDIVQQQSFAYPEGFFHYHQFGTSLDHVQPYQPEIYDADVSAANGYYYTASGASDTTHMQNNEYNYTSQVPAQAQDQPQASQHGVDHVQNNDNMTDARTQRSPESCPPREAQVGFLHRGSRRQHNKKLRSTLEKIDRDLK